MIGIARRRIPLLAGDEYVDLGLPSGLLWAKCNVGAATETDYGDYYRWGAITTSGDYDTQSSGTLPLEKDAAHVNMGGDWRMPTRDEMNELINNTTYSFVTINGVDGGKFTSKSNPNAYVFFPAAGMYLVGSPYGRGSVGYVWSSTPNSSSNAYALGFSSGSKGADNNFGRFSGFSVRGVHE